MSKLVLSGDTSGSVTLDAPAVAGTTTLTLPTTSGTIIASDSSGNVGIGTSSPTNALTVNGSGRFYGTYTEDTTNTGIHAGYINSTPRMGFFNGTAAQNWQIDNDSGNFRWFTPGVVRMQLTSAGLLQFNSGYGSVATAYGCRAWVNFNGTGTVAIRASGNVTSITDNNTGDYTINFTTAMPDINYSVVGSCRGQSDGDNNSTIFGTGVLTTTTAKVFMKNNGNGNVDSSAVNVAVFR
jgi:hypothetical protein